MASVLVVEDEADTLSLLRRWLEQAGYVVAGVASGEEAVSLAAGSAYDLVVLDVGLPGIDGFSVARELLGSVGTPVLMCSVSEQEDIPVDLCGVRWLAKPFTRAQLLAAVGGALDGEA